MSSGKGGGGSDTGPMLEYGNKALALQEKIYNESKAANEPYQAAGGAGLNELMMRLGLGGGTTSNRTADQIRASLAPSYTSQPAAAATNYYVTPDGRLVNANDKQSFYGEGANFNQGIINPGRGQGLGAFTQRELAGMDPTARGKAFEQMGYKPYSSSPGQTVDNSGLDAAVQKALAEQEASAASAQSNPLYGSLLKNFGMDSYQADPGYQFRLSEGNKAIERGLAASGQYMTPERQKALAGYGQNLASEEYGNAYNRYNQDQGNIFNRLAAITGIGQTAQAQNTATGQNYANSATDLYTGMGNSITAANQAKAANKGSMFNTLLGAGASLGGAYLSNPAVFAASDRRLKENVKEAGQENGFKTYTFTYKDDPMKRKFYGVMADEVKAIKPEAVNSADGYDAVNYDLIGVNFHEVHDAP